MASRLASTTPPVAGRAGAGSVNRRMMDAYPLKPFRIENIAGLGAIMRAYPLAALFSGAGAVALISLIPMLVHGETQEYLRLTGSFPAGSMSR